MAKESGKKSFLDFFKMKELDEDEFDDDLFDEDDDDDDDEDDDDDYTPVRSSRNRKSTSRKSSSSYNSNYNQSQSSYRDSQNHYDNYGSRQQNRVVEFSNPRPKSSGRSEVYVMIPHDTSESQTVADFLKGGKTIVLNMAGLDTTIAQRIIDFVAGSCYALDGTLQAISDNIFIAAPSSIEVSGDLRELINDNAGAPNLYRY